jgi:putative oxidoreductase
MTRHAIDVQRVAIGVVFVWFGVLKVAGHSPVAGLVTQTIGVAQLGHASAVGTLGVVEAGIGFGLLFGLALRTTLLLFILQQIGTFLVLIVRPEPCF